VERAKYCPELLISVIHCQAELLQWHWFIATPLITFRITTLFSNYERQIYCFIVEIHSGTVVFSDTAVLIGTAGGAISAAAEV